MRRALLLSLAFPHARYPGGGADLRRHALVRERPDAGRRGRLVRRRRRSFGGTFGYGTPKSFYGKAGLGSTSYDGFDGSSFDLNLGGGYQIPLQSQSTAQVCPVAN